MDGINETSADCTTTTTSVGRYSLRSEQNKFSGNDDDDEQHRDNGGISHSDSDNDDPPLSEYELLRLRKIKRNEARLAQLGLLVPTTATTATTATNNSNQREPSTNNNGGGASALTTLFLSSPQSSNNNKTKKQKQQQQDDTTTTKPLLVPRRILPKRHCTTSSRRRSFHNNNDNNNGNGYTSDDESSIAASPILPKRILTLQPHQAAAVAAVDGSNESSSNNESSSGSNVPSCPRRERRGRPRKEDYVYVCEEVCAHCGGEWRLDGGEVEEEEEVDTRLIRCKDCRGAFHLDCMMLHGKTETEAGGEEIRNDEDEALSCKENNSALALLQNDDKQDPAKVNASIDANKVIPKRCFQCECNKSKRAKRKASTPALEAIIVGKKKKKKKKMVTVRIISPELLPLEAVVCGKNVMCYVTLENS